MMRLCEPTLAIAPKSTLTVECSVQIELCILYIDFVLTVVYPRLISIVRLASLAHTIDACVPDKPNQYICIYLNTFSIIYA